MAMANVVAEVVHHDLCTGCGACAGICPSKALDTCTLPNGDLVVCAVAKCDERCDLCLRICPFVGGFHDPRSDNVTLYGPAAQWGAVFEEHVGWHRCCFVGFSRGADHRLRAASGGLATWCLEALLQANLVDKVAVVRLATQRSDSLFEFKVAQSSEEVRTAAGSVYHPVAISDVLQDIATEADTRWAVIGVPCLCAAVRKATAELPYLRRRIRYVLGLACGMLQNTMYTEMLVAACGVNLTDISGISYRHKSALRPANDYGFVAVDAHGNHHGPVWYKGLPYFLGRNAYFRYNACNYCKDVFAEVADACFMDAWLPEYITDFQGTSLVVVRSKSLERLLLDGVRRGDLQLDRIAAERVVLSQRGQVRRKQELIGVRLARQNIDDSEVISVNWKDRFDWWLQRTTQYRSKRAWSRYGRKYSPKAIGMAEYVYGHQEWVQPVEQFVNEQAVKTVDSLLRSRGELRQQLHAELPRFRRDAMRGAEVLKEFLTQHR